MRSLYDVSLLTSMWELLSVSSADSGPGTASGSGSWSCSWLALLLSGLRCFWGSHRLQRWLYSFRSTAVSPSPSWSCMYVKEAPGEKEKYTSWAYIQISMCCMIIWTWIWKIYSLVMVLNWWATVDVIFPWRKFQGLLMTNTHVLRWPNHRD